VPGATLPSAPGAPVATQRVLDTLDQLARYVIIVAMGAMVAIVSAEVLGRYALTRSIGWADEVSRLMFVASIFLAIPLGIRTQSHIGIELLTARLPTPLRAALVRVMAIVSAALMLLVAYQAARVAIDQWDEKMASVEFSAGLFLVPVAFGACHAALHLLRIAVFGPYAARPQVMALE
jgi:TRAP-type C4-dicarboxylate transport system permease small subunit